MTQTTALAAAFSLHMEGEEPERRVLAERPGIHERALPETMGSPPMQGRPPAQPPLLPPPTQSPLEKMRRNPKFPRSYDLVIHNTERLSPQYMKDMLQRIFNYTDPIRATMDAYCIRHIRKGGYPLDIAHIKANQVRCDAEKHEQPVPYMRYVPHGKS